jgi:hypothetical protein
VQEPLLHTKRELTPVLERCSSFIHAGDLAPAAGMTGCRTALFSLKTRNCTTWCSALRRRGVEAGQIRHRRSRRCPGHHQDAGSCRLPGPQPQLTATYRAVLLSRPSTLGWAQHQLNIGCPGRLGPRCGHTSSLPSVTQVLHRWTQLSYAENPELEGTLWAVSKGLQPPGNLPCLPRLHVVSG